MSESGLSPLKRAFLALEEMKAKLDALENGAAPPIAVIGIGCRFPGDADTPEAFWRLLAEGRDAIRETPRDRWDVDALYDPDPSVPGKMYTKWGGFLSSVDRFDPQFFGISPREAVSMDPQQRLLLEVSWEALEHAGQAPDRLVNSATGVFVGICTTDYATLQMKSGRPDEIDLYQASGSAHSIASGRLSYVLGLQGPSVSIDTACSSSLVAIHLACQSLRTKECRMALAGGVHLSLSPENTISFCKSRMLAFDGHCKTFDAAADGFAEGEGCGIVVLKRLSDAVADGDRILAVIRGSAVNQDGPSSGLTAPNGPAQEAVIRAALTMGKVAPGDVSYVEAHGTGTSLGDPIELQALAGVLRSNRGGKSPLLIGSVKTNVGHLEAAAGVAGLIKVVLALQHEAIPPHLHFRNPNPHVPWSELPLSVVTAVTPWPEAAKSRIAGVSAFGFSGTNAHIVLEQPPAPASVATAIARPLHPVALSGRGEDALRAVASRWADAIEAGGDLDIARIAYTANAARAHLSDRVLLVAGSTADLRASLAAIAAGEWPDGTPRGHVATSDRPKIAFLFTGQGSQYAGMARELFESEPTFRQALTRCDELFRPHVKEPLLSVLYPGDGLESPINETFHTQASLFSIEYALVELWKSWGVTPTAVLGHSLGEYVAAVVAGIFSLEDAVMLVATRGRLMQAQPPGGRMAAVFASERQVRQALSGHEAQVSIAAVNGPESIVISGAAGAFEAVTKALEADGVRINPLTVSHAFHSPQMDPLLDAFEAAAASVTYASPQIALVSNVTGQVAQADVTTPSYWRRHLREPVQFAKGIDTLIERGLRIFVEIGPAPVLAGMAQRFVSDGALAWLPSLRKGRGDWAQILHSLGELHVRGASVDWKGFHRHDGARPLALPTYPFQRARYWIDAARQRQDAGESVERQQYVHPLLGRRLRSALKDVQFESVISVAATPFLADHRKHGTIVFPATAYLEMARAAAAEVFQSDRVSVEDLVMFEALALPDDGSRTVQLVLSKTGADAAQFQIFSLDAAGSEERWVPHATGTLRTRCAAPPIADVSLDELKARLGEDVSAAAYYEQMEQDGHSYGPAFRGLTRIWRGKDEVLAEVELPRDAGVDADRYGLHPALLDAALQLLGAAAASPAGEGSRKLYLPVSLDRVVIRTPGCRRFWSHTRVRTDLATGDARIVDVNMFDDNGAIAAEVEGMRLQPASAAALRKTAGAGAGEWLHEVVWRDQAHDSQLPAPDAQPGVWLVLSDREGFGRAVASELERRGNVVIAAEPAERYQFGLDGSASLRPGEPRDFQKVCDEAASLGPLRGVVHMWGLNAAVADSSPASSMADAQLMTCGSLLHLVQALAVRFETALPRLWTVTRGAQAVGAVGRPIAVAQAPIWALSASIAAEYPDLASVAIDLDPSGPVDAEALVRDITTPDGEDRIAFREGRRFVARLVPAAGAPSPSRAATPFNEAPRVLDIAERGVLDHLQWKAAARRAPGPGEVEIGVAATGLNFRDVLNALGMYEGPAGPFGTECAGTVVGIGPGVADFKVGDEVMAFGGDTFRTFVTLPAALVTRKPSGLSLEEAATIPATFLTAFHALTTLALMSAGDRVLIHAAAGGVGLAAVQLAQRAGAEIFATAGSDEKRQYLRSLGVRHVMSSRTLDFADQIMSLTNGQGVDIVLNSLSGAFIPKSLSALGKGGRFLEIGKKGIWTSRQMAEARPDVAYHAIYLGELEPERIHDMFEELGPAFAARSLAPLRRRVFAADDVVGAFRFMAQAKHIGKIVISHRPESSGQPGSRVRGDASYLITGGYGALGSHVARWLVGAGARHIVLMGRHTPAAEGSIVAELRSLGVDVLAAQGDVAREEDVRRVLAEIERAMPPLAGVIHAAGVVDDGTIAQQDWARFERVAAPKVQGAWNLHLCTRERPIDFFVMFSSMVSMFGAPGQGSYAASNAFLDALAHQRRRDGLPALSIDWGPWAGSGMAGEVDERRHQRWSAQGVDFMAPEEALGILPRLLASQAAQVGVLPVRWGRMLAAFPEGRVPPFLRELERTASAAAPARAKAAVRRDLRAEVERTPAAGRRGVVLACLRDLAVKVLSLDSSQPIDVREPLSELGLDSLMAVELRNSISELVGRSLPATLLFKYPTLAALTDYVLDDVLELSEPDTSEPVGGVDRDLAEVEPLGDEDIKRLLLEELNSLGPDS